MAEYPGSTTRADETRGDESGGSGDRRTVLIALGANALIAVVKLAGGLVSGSTALLAEAAHSLADTTNQSFLLASIALAERGPSTARPFGNGQHRFLWTLVAAVGMFIAGAVFALGYGLVELFRGNEPSGGFAVAWLTLAIAALAEGTSWARATRQTRAEARKAQRPFLRFVRESRDPTVKMVLFEDTAALVGIALAAVGIGLHQLTGRGAWDPVASILIGLMLIGVGGWMARAAGTLLIGAPALPDERKAIERVIQDHPDVARVQQLLTMVLGPHAILVAARLDFDDRVNAADVEHASTAIDLAVRDAVPDVAEVFLDATPARN